MNERLLRKFIREFISRYRSDDVSDRDVTPSNISRSNDEDGIPQPIAGGGNVLSDEDPDWAWKAGEDTGVTIGTKVGKGVA